MKLQVLQDKLSKALTTASRFTSTRAQLPVLGNILLTAKKNKLLVSSTNLEISISISIGAQIEKEGEITIPSKIITDLVSNLPKETINLETEKEHLKIMSEKFNSTVSGMNASDFPSVPQNVGKGVISFPREELAIGLSQVLFSASIDETRPILTGVLFIFGKKTLTLVSTDGFRLSQKKLSLEKVLKEEKIILPKNALSEVVRLSSDDDNVSFSFKPKDNQAVFGLGSSVLSTRILEGEFPNFEKIIPKESKVEILLDKEEALRAVKLASVFARDAANVIKIKIKKNSIDISAESQQSGEQTTNVDAKVEGNYDKGFEIAFNYRFLEEFLNAVGGEEVSFTFSEPSSPGVFRDTSDKNYLHLIMPVRTQS